MGTHRVWSGVRVMGCEHDFAERENSVTVDGMCPLCMAADLTRLRAVAEAAEQASDLLETAWGIIANAGGGDWQKETEVWQGAVSRWRENYFAWDRAWKETR